MYKRQLSIEEVSLDEPLDLAGIEGLQGIVLSDRTALDACSALHWSDALVAGGWSGPAVIEEGAPCTPDRKAAKQAEKSLKALGLESVRR